MPYITGIGKTKFGVLEAGLAELMYEAMLKAVKDAHLSITDVQAIYIGNFMSGILQNQLHLNSLLAGLLPGLHLPIVRVETACASGGAAFHQATLALHKYHTILVVGVEKMNGYENKHLTTSIAAAGDFYLDQNNGVIFPANYALIAERYMQEYGLTADDLNLLSLKAHQNARLNELAHFHHKEITLDQIKNSPLISSPLRLFDCAPISDGAAALVLSQKKRSSRDVKILSSVLKTDSLSLVQRNNVTTFPAAKLAAAEAYAEARITSSEIDVAQVHDCFTIAEVLAMEDLNFCEIGSSKDLIRKNATSLTGKLPINTDGGLKANGHPIGATGVSQIYEIVTQLRGEAGERQVKDAKIGLTHNVGGVGGTAVVSIFSQHD